MARTPIQQQATVGSSAPQATVRDTFSQARVNNQGAERLQRLSAALGVTSRFAQQEQQAAQQAELESAERELEDGVARGMISDGTAIRNGELDPADSPYFRRGVEIGRARAAALQMGLMLDERRQRSILDGNPPPTDPVAYMEWREGQLAEIQEEMGVDPDALTPMASREYAGSLTEVRNMDAQRQRAFANEQLQTEAIEQVDLELLSIWQGHEDSTGALEATSSLLTSARARGLDGTELKRRAAAAAISEANRRGDPTLLDNYMEQTELMSSPLLERLTDERRVLQNRIDAEREARRREAEEAETDARNLMLDQAALSLASNPYAPMPPEVIQSGSEAVTSWQRLQNAFVTNRENSVHPALQAAALDSIYGIARQDGGGQYARQELDRALMNNRISNDQYARASQQIRQYEENAGVINDPQINRYRGMLDIQAGINGLGGDAMLRLENDRKSTFDALVLESVAQWRMENPQAQTVPQGVLFDIGNDVMNRVLDASSVDAYSSIDGTDSQRSSLSSLRGGRQQSSSTGSSGEQPRTRPF